MARSVDNYLIDQTGIDWQTALLTWSWLVPPDFTLRLFNRIADLFLVFPDGTVHMLDVGAGTLTKVAENRDDFTVRIDQGDNANDWLAIPVVDKFVAAGFHLQPGQCYGFKKRPILGGDYTVENFAPISVWDYLGAYGSIHDQLRGLPDRNGGSDEGDQQTGLSGFGPRIHFFQVAGRFLSLPQGDGHH